MNQRSNFGLLRIQTVFTEIFGLGRAAAITTMVVIAAVVILAVYWFIHLAPPHTITITSGPQGSIFQTNAEKYRAILAKNGVKLRIVPSQGSLENLKRLTEAAPGIDIGFVQGGLVDGLNIDHLVSLGSLYNQPLLIFYRSAKPIGLLSQFDGKRLAIGPQGSGSRALALTLLLANEIQPGGPTQMLDIDADDAANALIDGMIDAVFLAGDSASVDNIRKLMRAPGVRIFNFFQADAYARRMSYLTKLELPQGAIDFGKNIPANDVYLIGPTIELIARKDLHPALTDLLLEAAREVHGRAGLFRRQDEFPAPLQHEFRISSDALSFYKSGKRFLYRYLPFWVASVVNRILVVVVPTIIVLIPVLRAIPAIYKWRIRLGIYRWYRALMIVERDVAGRIEPRERDELLERLDHIERAVNKMKVPASFADQFYSLRGHINLVRNSLMQDRPPR